MQVKKKRHSMRKVQLEQSPEMRRHRYSEMCGNLSQTAEMCPKGKMIGVDLGSLEL